MNARHDELPVVRQQFRRRRSETPQRFARAGKHRRFSDDEDTRGVLLETILERCHPTSLRPRLPAAPRRLAMVVLHVRLSDGFLCRCPPLG